MSSSKKQQSKEYEKLQRLVRVESLGLPPEAIDLEFENPLEPKTKDEVENPHIHLLRVVRNPINFGFTCKKIFNVKLAPFQLVILNELWHRKYPMLIASRGGSKSFMLALYAMLRALLHQGTKIVIVGSAFRQAKVIFEYCEHIWHNAPVLRDIVGISGRSGPRRDIDRCTCTIGESIIIAIPLGDGTKIRGYRANVIIADEFASIPKSIYEEVVSGFASVQADPIESMERAALVRIMKRMNQWTLEMEERELKQNLGNQAIISGTANYAFNHFADYWKEYKGIIESKGDPKVLLEIFKGKIPRHFNWRNFSIIRLPVELLPENFMDEEHVARAQVTTDSGTYAIEYGAVFAGDSNGFYKRSLIESCVVTPDNVSIMLPGVQVFSPMLRGFRDKEYVFSVDTASEQDNFAIAILELHTTHRRIVYGWTTSRAKHLERIRHGAVQEKNFYAYCARKIRDLMKVFRCKHISMDSQGGGRAVLEALHDMDKLQFGELPIWEVRSDDPMKPNEDDDKAGLHIVELINFADAKWVSEANHGMKKDFEDKILLFPYFDPIKLYEANLDDKKAGRIIINKKGEEVQLQDTFEDAVMEIEALKDELVTIVHTQTPNTNRDRWDTPEIKQAGGKKGRLRKDRYSAVLMANMAARQMARAPAPLQYSGAGGFAKDCANTIKETKGMPMYDAPDWFLNPESPYEFVGKAVKRNKQDIGVFHNR
jgi:hypothetical protein